MNDLEKDILTEIFNISLAKAADSFAKISNEEILINVPHITFMKEETALSSLIQDQNIFAIVQSEIKGDIYGQTLLLFSQRQIIELVNVALKTDVKDSVLQNSLILEISNILTGTLVTQLANILKLNIYGSVPNEPIDRSSLKAENLILDLDISRSILVTINTLFIKRQNSIDLPLMLIFDIPNFNKILDTIRKVNVDNKLLTKK
ncbi:MAG: chemotaxis protein CheC [Candidatus Cyclobacteriaceae bacterium M2_1C_046]